jgi:zinc transporter 6
MASDRPLTLFETFSAVVASREPRTRTLGAVTLALLVLLAAELAAGAALGSVGLLADALHALFHCVALCVSLWGLLHAGRAGGGAYSYGFARFEVLAAFSNATLLVFMQLFLVAGVVHRLIEPANFAGDRASGRAKVLLGAAGVVINVWAVAALGGRTSNLLARLRAGGGSSGGTASGGSGSSGGGSGGSGGGARAGGRDAFTLALYSDAFSSLMLVVSAFAAPHIGAAAADIAQAALSAAYTLSLVVPLAAASADCLLAAVPPAAAAALDRARRDALAIDGVLEVTAQHFWLQAPGHGVCTVALRVRHEASERDVLAAAQRAYARVALDLTVQLEKDAQLDDWRALAAGMGLDRAAAPAFAIAVDTDAEAAHAHSHGAHAHSGHGAHGHSHAGGAACAHRH